MRQPFVNATINDRRKGKEHSAQNAQPHPARPTAISSEHALPLHRLPVRVVPVAKKEEPSELDKMKAELVKLMAASDVKKPKKVAKSKLIGMAMESAVAEEPTKDYADVLAMLLAKK
jgi:hypothetical protein